MVSFLPPSPTAPGRRGPGRSSGGPAAGAAAACLLLALAGCGGSHDTSDAAPHNTPSGAASAGGQQDQASARPSSSGPAGTVSYTGPSGSGTGSYTRVDCSSYGQQGNFSVLASDADDKKATLSVVVKDGKYDQLSFTTDQGRNWMAAFGASESGNAATAARTSGGTSLDLGGLKLKMLDATSGEEAQFTLDGHLDCTSGRTDTGDVAAGGTADPQGTAANTLSITGGLQEKMKLGQVLCTPAGEHGVIAVGQRERNGDRDTLTITLSGEDGSVLLSIDKGTKGDLDNWGATTAERKLPVRLDGKQIVLSAVQLPSANGKKPITLNGVLRCTEGALPH
ncbi:hypothetical protein ACL02U_20440 [Streptomyces sp. MS06]|uniref:hypothetical protein n=1 Tax=Streptomyces sp. MS06 TaxID=3385974 RepID=UPI0039A361C3